MKVPLLLGLFTLSLLVVGEATRHHSSSHKSHGVSLMNQDALEYFATTSRHRKSKKGHSTFSKHRQRLGPLTESNELQQGGDRATVSNKLNFGVEQKKEKVWLNSTEANKQIEALIKNRYKNETAMLKKPKKENGKKKKNCDSIAMLQCGCGALKLFEEALKGKTYVKVETRCEIRQKFFECLGNATKAVCHRPNLKLIKPKSAYQKHKKEIVRVLWTTRECLLGAVDQKRDKSMSASELKINSGFCRKFVPHKNGRHKKIAKKSKNSQQKLIGG